MEDLINLVQIHHGKRAVILSINGGYGLIRKLDALGIRVGMEIEKISTGIAHGPVVLRCGNTEAAIGFGMAQKILVKEI